MSTVAHYVPPAHIAPWLSQAMTLLAVAAIVCLAWLAAPRLIGLGQSTATVHPSGFAGVAYPVRAIEIQRGPQLTSRLVQKRCEGVASAGSRCWVSP